MYTEYYNEHALYEDALYENNTLSRDDEDFWRYLAEAGNLSEVKPPKRHANHITDKDALKEILSIDHDIASRKSTIMDYFCNFGDGARYNPYDIIEVPAHAYGGLSNDPKYKDYTKASTKTNSQKFTTTIGLWIFNKAFIEPMNDILGYINEPITKKKYGSLNNAVSYALLEDKISVQQLKDFIMQSQIMMSCCSALAPSHTETIFNMEKDIAKEKAKLQEEYGERLESGDLVAIKEYEDKLIAYAKDYLKDDPAVDMYNSGARGSWDNNFKNMYLTRGSVKKTSGEYKAVTTSYIEGMDPKDFADINDSAIQGPYSRSRLTASGGYVEKLFTSLTQHIKIGEKGSDCGTKRTVTVELTKDNIGDWYFSYMLENGKLIELTPEIGSKYLGKTVHFRFSALCESKTHICEKCAGTFFNRIGINNAGMASMIMMSSVKNSNMRAFHDSNLKLSKLSINEVF